jgi:hypothetical protein
MTPEDQLVRDAHRRDRVLAFLTTSASIAWRLATISGLFYVITITHDCSRGVLCK